VMADSNSDTPAHLAQLQKAGESRGLEVILRTVAKRDDVIAAIRDVKTAGVQAINFLATPMFSINAGAFIAEVTNLGLASIYQWPEDAEAGALLSYGPRITNMYRVRGRYRGQGAARHVTRRYSDRAADEIRARGQSQDRQGDRYRSGEQSSAARRQGDRITVNFCCDAYVRFWHKADIPTPSTNVHFGSKVDTGLTLLNFYTAFSVQASGQYSVANAVSRRPRARDNLTSRSRPPSHRLLWRCRGCSSRSSPCARCHECPYSAMASIRLSCRPG
jgi:hypothetical protein